MNNSYCYIHIPFCNSKCKYCRFASFGIIEDLKIELYVKHLLKEIEKNETDFKNLKSVYFGGGTPSILKIGDLEKIIILLKNKFGFSNNIEITIEATPDTISIENIKGWKKIGINRLSMGLQTLNNKSLLEIGRANKGDIMLALDNIKKEGFGNVSIDFIIGLPYVKQGEIVENIELLTNSYDFIKHVSVYMLEEYYDIVEEKDSKFDNIVYPDNWNKLGLAEEKYLEEYITVKNKLAEIGFNRYEISNFSRIGYKCNHNRAYWNHSEVLAFGLGAHGFINNIRYSNSENFLEYYSGKNIFKEVLKQEDFFIEKIMFELRTLGLTPKTIRKLDKVKIDAFIEMGYLEKKSNKITLLDKGVLIMDYILSEIYIGQ